MNRLSIAKLVGGVRLALVLAGLLVALVGGSQVNAKSLSLVWGNKGTDIDEKEYVWSGTCNESRPENGQELSSCDEEHIDDPPPGL